jgi:chromosome segregation ATPase
MKKSIQSGSVKVVKAIACPLHIACILGANIVAGTEGFIVEKIDGTPSETTQYNRFEYTFNKMEAAAKKLEELKSKLQSSIDDSKKSVKKAVDKVKSEIKQPKEDIPSDVKEFRLSTLRAQRDKIVKDNPELSPEHIKTIARLNREINKVNKDLPLVKPEQAFEPAMA